MTRTLGRLCTLVEAQVKLLLRNRLALVGSLGLAVVSMLIFGTLFGGNGAAPLAVCVVDRDHSPASIEVKAAFHATSAITTVGCASGQDMTTLDDGDLAAIVVLPAGFGRALAAGQATAHVYYDSSNPVRGGQAQATIAAIIGGVNRAITHAPEPVAIRARGIGHHTMRTIDWMTPGMAGMMVMWTNLAVGATLIAWRERGILKRLAVTPLRPLTLMSTQILARLLFSLLQVVVLLVIARVVFGVQIAGSYWALGLIVIIGTLAILACGFVIGSFVPRSESAQAISTLIAFPMMFLAGSYFPLDGAPSFMQPIINALPLTYINHALRQIMLYGAGIGALQKDMLVLLAWMAASLFVATRAFRWSTEAR